MAEQTEVEWPPCEAAGCIGVHVASAPMCLAHASEEQTAAALKLVSETGMIDARGVPITPALLEQILVGKHSGPALDAAVSDRGLRLGGMCGVAVVAVRGFRDDCGL